MRRYRGSVHLTVFLVNNYRLSVDLKFSRTYSEDMTATTHCIEENNEVTNYYSRVNYRICVYCYTFSALVYSEFRRPSVNKIIYVLLLFSASMASGIIANKVAHDSR